MLAIVRDRRRYYWTVSTMTTVGYGDELPTTAEAKVLSMGEGPDDLGRQVDRLAERARELVAELEALQLAVAAASPARQDRQ